MQALKFKLLSPTQFLHQRSSMGVVGGKLGIYDVLCFEQLRGTHLVTQIRIGFARENRVIGVAFFLRELDLAVPVGAFDQSYDQFAAGIATQLDQPLCNPRGTLAVGLQHEAESIPARQFRIASQGLENVQ